MSIELKAINSIRTLSIDMVEKANSGHPGMPMGAAPMAYELWTNHMKHNPNNPQFFDRDRFVLSAGHGSALLYSLLHLTGYDLSLEEIKNFRQLGSETPGHPEYGHTVGVEATTGPLGQGISTAVGMAMAEAHLAATYNQEGYSLVDHYTYTICGDGDLMEGIASEAASMAGHMGLGKLIVLYDSNDISLDGDLHMSFSENVEQRFKAYGWHYTRVEDGTDTVSIGAAIAAAKAEKNRPTLIEIKTVIGHGSPNKSGKSASHGAPLGSDEVKLTKEQYGWEHEPFFVPDEVRHHFAQIKENGAKAEASWNELFENYEQQFPELAKQFKQAINGELPEGWDKELPVYGPESPKMATRQSSGAALNAIATHLPTLFGGSADLAGSNNTTLKGLPNFSKENFAGKNIWFGVREHAMGAALNGLALHGGVRPFGGTFFVFSDYLRPSIRLAAMMKQPVVYVFTHDSIAVGEDGPTHEPVEQLPSLRVIPGLTVIRPADANETTEAYRYAFSQNESPVAMVLTRQALPVLEGSAKLAKEGVQKGAYVLSDCEGDADVILLATGSEVSLAVEAKEQLKKKDVAVRVVSMPSWELFEQQTPEYKESVLPSHIKARVAIEMAYPLGWERYVGDKGAIIGINTFGASGNGNTIVKEFGFHVDNVIAHVEKLFVTEK
ncbi:transketolase [Alkalihalobacterium bogoriense]|uniref:transketolase n=1 Tax=Alkalihalobacterium bogoriense TaxID=246272 RepID=UPI00047B23A2|nr:transketolase [Alkalihalobacterium bogoriense]